LSAPPGQSTDDFDAIDRESHALLPWSHLSNDNLIVAQIEQQENELRYDADPDQNQGTLYRFRQDRIAAWWRMHWIESGNSDGGTGILIGSVGMVNRIGLLIDETFVMQQLIRREQT
jgi:hypothetical protein